MVEKEDLDFLVLLQNPYIFDLELEKVSLRYVLSFARMDFGC